MVRPLAENLRFSNFIMNLVIRDLSNEDAVRRARGEEGASIAWVVGHLCHYRREMMSLLGAQATDPHGEIFTGSAGDGSDYPSIFELLKRWNEIHDELAKVLESVTDDQLLSRLAAHDSPHSEKTVLESFVFLVWHESYHLGQLGTLRTQLGYPATAELAVAASRSD
jgi:uncharacterized damage-inducible protein DinB